MGESTKALQKSYLWWVFILIFVTVGSRPYPFDRLFKELDNLISQGIIKEPIFAQIGSSKYKPQYFEYEDYLSPKDFNQKLEDADIVISHGASGSIVKALKANKKTIGVTRLERFGEHIDDHQIQMNQAFEENNFILAVYDLDDLKNTYVRIKNENITLSKWVDNPDQSPLNLVDDFIQKNWYR